MAKFTDIALIAGIAAVGFIIWKSGRDLFGALPALGEGIAESLEGTRNFIAESAAGTQEFFADSLQGTQDFFAQQQENFNQSLEQQQTNFSNFFESLQGLSREPVNIVFNEEQQQIADETGRKLDDLDCKCGTSFFQGADGQTEIKCIPCENQDEKSIEASADDPRFQEGQGEIIPKSEVDNDFFASRALEKRGFTRDEFGNIVRLPQDFPISNQAQTELETEQQFQFNQAEGSSFAGGSINETPIENLSLGQIIDKFNVTASQAADIRAQARDDFGDFDFGTNTGNAEFAASREIPEFGSFQGGGITGDESFQGLSPEEIMRQILGGSINNF